MSEEKYSLKNSRDIIGELYPKIVDKYGNMIDGFTRGKESSEWRTESRDQIDTPVKLWVARISANTHRRTVGRGERADQIRHLAEELTKEGVSKEDLITTIVKLTTFSERYVRELLPDIYKQRPGLGGVRVELSSTQKPEIAPVTQKTPEEVLSGFKPEDFMPEISGGVRSFIAHQLEKYCGLTPEDAEQAIRAYRSGQEASKVRATLREAEQMAKPVKVETKVKDRWEYREALMHPPVSRMEEMVGERLRKAGIKFDIQKDFCVQNTSFDFYVSDSRVAVYLDGPVHKGREDRDEAIRDRVKRRGLKVIEVDYDAPTDEQADEAARQIVEALGKKAGEN